MWTPKLEKDGGPMYLAIADAIATDVASGRLTAGTKLPPQRSLAQELGVDFTTVTRAYQEAGRRGLVDGRVGQGTFVKGRAAVQPVPVSPGVVDMSMNLPPIPEDDSVAQTLWGKLADIHGSGASRLMLRYQEPGGSAQDRAAGIKWLRGRAGELEVGKLLVAPGAQGALTATLATLARRGETVLVEPLTYPGFISLAAHLGIRLEAVQMDDEGPLPASMEQAIQASNPKAFYCTPTLHNPTTTSWSADRRARIAQIAGKAGLPIIEDDAYGALPDTPLPSLAAIGAGPVYHVASLSKSLAPALRIAYLVAPDAGKAARLAGALRGTTAMASPLTAALATDWIESGLAFDFLDALRAESRSRQDLVRSLLAGQDLLADPQGFHALLRLPQGWQRGEFIFRLRNLGVLAVASDAFAIGSPPEAVRLGLGGPQSRADLHRSLGMIASLLADQPAVSSLIV
ncbi:MAG: GntR family transcriptional regulator [Methylobacterium sp. SCN 67-24]|nr:MAG: GntR family transcriptional regulator [Methylobacterium sp. SCN 67-24]